MCSDELRGGIFNKAMIKNKLCVARDVPGKKRIPIMKINARHDALSKAIKTRFKIANIFYVRFHLNLRHLHTIG